MSETFPFDVAFDTAFGEIEALRDKMLAFVKQESRDFLPSFDIVVVDIPEQEKMSLTADINYKSNWQQGALKVKRRNKWVCALKQSMADIGIYGPMGKPTTSSDPAANAFSACDAKKQVTGSAPPELEIQKGDYRLADRNAVILDSSRDVFGEAAQLAISNPQSPTSRARPSTRPSGARMNG